jgi:hypothetical protein
MLRSTLFTVHLTVRFTVRFTVLNTVLNTTRCPLPPRACPLRVTTCSLSEPSIVSGHNAVDKLLPDHPPHLVGAKTLVLDLEDTLIHQVRFITLVACYCVLVY